MFACALLILATLTPVPVSPAELGANPEIYNRRMVRVEIILEGFDPSDRWVHAIPAVTALHTDVVGRSKPDARNGDRVAIIGFYRYRPNAFGERLISGAHMVKIPFLVEPAELLKEPEKYNGRLVRVETVLKDFRSADEWTYAVKAGKGSIAFAGKGKPIVRDGDKVAFTGTFARDRVSGCTVEAIPLDITAEQVRHQFRALDGRLVRFADEVEDVREGHGQQLVTLKTRGLEVEWAGTVSVGDRVRVTGVFVNRARNSFKPPQIDVSKGGTLEKLPAGKP